MPVRTLPTLGAIADRFDVRLHQADYVVRKLGIEPIGRAGRLRVYADADVERIGDELRRIESESALK